MNAMIKNNALGLYICYAPNPPYPGYDLHRTYWIDYVGKLMYTMGYQMGIPWYPGSQAEAGYRALDLILEELNS
jgi:hypothetical protein